MAHEIGNMAGVMEAWINFEEGVDILIVYASRKKGDKVIRDASTKRGKLDQIEGYRLLGRAVVKDWRGFTKHGVEFPYSVENCDLLMTRYHDFGDFVQEKCVELSNFVEEEEREAEKKSGPTSSGG